MTVKYRFFVKLRRFVRNASIKGEFNFDKCFYCGWNMSGQLPEKRRREDEMKAVWQGEKLAVRRKQVGLTMAQLAEKVGCDRPLVSMWESGKVAPSGHFLVMLGIALNIEPKELYILEDEVVSNE